MRVLGIETSTDMGGVALVEDGVLRAEWTWNLPRGHSVRLIPAVEAVLKGLDWRVEDLDGVAVGVGPGSFTGLRIGLATAKGFALALGKPIVGIPSLDAMVYGLPSSRPLCAITDAKRG
ncbi:MAG: tRNA (adenosine(37)-N6)-threonylcarbamoyltransferase complex dimerization subunit type 1 TsaB, partial [Deltaproteobacteria bacterium]